MSAHPVDASAPNGTGNGEVPMPMFQMSNPDAAAAGDNTQTTSDNGLDIGQLDLEELFVDCYYDIPGMADMANNQHANGAGGFDPPNPAPAPAPVAAAPAPMQVPSVPVVAPASAVAPAVAGDPAASAGMVAPPPQPVAVTSTVTDSKKRSADNISGDPEATITTGGQLTAKQKLERRERNREHAKRSRLRKKFLLESLQEQIHGLQEQLEKFKKTIRTEIPAPKAEQLIDEICGHENKYTPLPMPSGFGPVKTLMEPDFRLMSALSGSQQNFAISDPTLPDNPIVYVSQGFLDLTGYQLDQVLGRNCRFLQGPGTDQSAVDVIRKGISEGIDTSVCLLNYKADGTPFWNQFFVAALRDAENNVVNYVGVQCEVSKAVVEKHMGEHKKK
mmetsp:Transcript_24467/g.57534  ORF Transcript_24467/g.57534 Transcript_24467/m.57534 type:complete len:389 (-) Transcript_24467:1979-3145(-)|eukprot:CAMPEP_0197193840 /NCGR_PEP_ID=MMETSP1423-20130617/28093_1 /TAXON_ID=476441 /ORGANISM="Pseudo-nitzschia heimii, Strain UNC1101" /LENGTH=388 /DNA_ID=CAMNT_0042647151 /DNA_START=228 /DNA_END=1394 /DNA_ORIENTATION=-